MIKRLLFLIIIIGAAQFLKAQEFNGGLVAGICGTEISHDRVWGPNKIGIYAGGFVSLDLTEKSSIQLELDFIQKGARNNPDSLNPDRYILRLNYIEMPLHYRYNINRTWDIEAGLSLGYLIHEYEEINYFDITGTSLEPVRKTDISANFGFYYRLTDRAKLNLRYSNSIFYFREFPQGTDYWIFDGYTNEVLSFTIHYTF